MLSPWLQSPGSYYSLLFLTWSSWVGVGGSGLEMLPSITRPSSWDLRKQGASYINSFNSGAFAGLSHECHGRWATPRKSVRESSGQHRLLLGKNKNKKHSKCRIMGFHGPEFKSWVGHCFCCWVQAKQCSSLSFSFPPRTMDINNTIPSSYVPS